jgi:DNA-binding NarL/FixJ family response regulator
VEHLRVLIADDHPVFRDGLRTLLASVPETEVVGEASTGDEAIAQAAALQPDVILMDLHMPGHNGIEACTGYIGYPLAKTAFDRVGICVK